MLFIFDIFIYSYCACYKFIRARTMQPIFNKIEKQNNKADFETILLTIKLMVNICREYRKRFIWKTCSALKKYRSAVEKEACAVKKWSQLHKDLMV